MKEERYFYVPNAETSTCLPADEANHVVRVLRLGDGDELKLVDGKGTLYNAIITKTTKHECFYKIADRHKVERQRVGRIIIAVSPTKMSERTEWMVEKATEIGVDEIRFLDCMFSERHTVNCERLTRIAVSAMKQSHKAWLPQISDMTAFNKFINAAPQGQKFIAHCYSDADVGLAETEARPFLLDVLKPHADAVVMVGPEGDFSLQEVRAAIKADFKPVSLGHSRLRTETAALVAVHFMSIKNSK